MSIRNGINKKVDAPSTSGTPAPAKPAEARNNRPPVVREKVGESRTNGESNVQSGSSGGTELSRDPRLTRSSTSADKRKSDSAPSSNPNQTNESRRTQHSPVPASQIDFAKISGQIKEVRQDVEEINAKLLKILEELEGYVRDNPDLKDKVLAIQNLVKKAENATEVAKRHLETAERQKDAIDKELKQGAKDCSPSTDPAKIESEKDKKKKKKMDSNKPRGDGVAKQFSPSTGEPGGDKNNEKKKPAQTNSGSSSSSSTSKIPGTTPRVEEVHEEPEV